MGATYTRQSSGDIVDGSTIEASHFNDEFDQLLAAFAVSTGHTHDGTAAEGGPVTKLLGTAITIGDGTAGTDIAVTFDGESNNGVLTWMEDEDLFKFSDAINVGVDDTGYDVKFFGDTASRYWLWDTSADGVVQRGTLTVGVDDAGHDVKFFGDTASAYMLWDTSVDDLVLAGAAGIDLAGDIDVDGTANLDNTDIDGTFAVDGTTISLDATTSLNIDNSNTSNGITLGTATSGVPISIGHTTSETTINDNLTVTGTLTGTLATAAQGSVTSLGTLTALTVDDVAIDGKVVTMTGSSSDTAVFTAGTNGTLSIVTTDAAAAAANIQITADGTVDIDSAGVLTLDSGAAINIEPASGSAILLDGTISVDAGVVTGATSITSTAFVGTLSTAAQTNITSLGTLTALTVDDVAVDGKVVTMTGSSSDTAVFTAGTNGTLSIVTTDDAAAAANITITADGTFEADGTTVTLDSAGDIVLDAGGADVTLKDDGTTYGSLTQSGGELIIKSGSTPTTAMTFSGANVTFAGTVTIGSAGISETELEILDGATVTTTELNLIDGDTARGTTAVASGDGILINDAGTMRMTNVDTVSTYFASHSVGGGNIVTTGALDSGSITSGFGTIDTGSSTITTTGLISGGSLDIDNVLIDGTTIGHTDDTDLLTVANAALTLLGTLTVGVDDTGHDVKFFGASAGAYLEWDESADQLRIMGASADATTSTGKLLLATSLTDVNASDVIGKIDFQAPHEAGGTDAITIAASIQAIAQGTFSSSVNATDLIFYTGHSEAATEKFRFTSQGEIGIGGANYGTDGQVLTSGGAGAAPAWEDAGGGGGTSWQAIKTGAYTASAGEGVFANTTSSAFTVTLPASPSLGDEVSIIDYAGTFDTNNLTVGRNSQPIQGTAADLTVSTERAAFTLVYVDSTQGWLLKNK